MPRRRIVLGIAAVALLASSSLMAEAGAKTTARASVGERTILVGGRPFFPVMLIDQCTAAAAGRARRLGVNLIVNESCDGVAPGRQLTAAGRSSYAVLPIAERSVGGPRLVGWSYPDEPEDNGWTPASLGRAFPAVHAGSPDGLLSFVTLSAKFFHAPYRDTRVTLGEVGAFARLADVAGFDLYPLNHCQQDLTEVADAQREFARLAAPTPTFQWIETGPIEPGYCGGFQMTPAQLGAETWLAIIGGARGIGFFTHTWSPTHSTFDVPPALQQAIARTTASIAALAPGLTGQTLLSGTNDGYVRVLARSGGNETYVFAVNAAPGPVQAEIHVPALHDGTARLFGESRSVRVHDGRIVDSFGPLGIHIYLQRPEG